MSASPKAGSWIHSMNPITSSSATGSFIPDSPSSERASRFSTVERRRTAKIAAESVAATAAPTSIPSSSVRSKMNFAASAGDQRRQQRAEGRQRGGRAQHRPDLAPAGGQPALEQDQDQRHGAQRPRQLGVVEFDPADPFRAGQHAEAEEEQQARDPHPVGEQGTRDPGGEQDPGDQDQLGIVSAHRAEPRRPLLERALRPARRASPAAPRAPRPSPARARPRGARAAGGRPSRAARGAARRRAGSRTRPGGTRR